MSRREECAYEKGDGEECAMMASLMTYNTVERKRVRLKSAHCKDSNASVA